MEHFAMIRKELHTISYFRKTLHFKWLAGFWTRLWIWYARAQWQKQTSRGVLTKRCSENMWKIYWSTPTPKCDFTKVANRQLYLNQTSAWVFSCKFAAYFQNTTFKNTTMRLPQTVWIKFFNVNKYCLEWILTSKLRFELEFFGIIELNFPVK